MEHNRYKQRGMQFNSAIDSRALRAVQYQEGRRSRRYDAISYRRQLDNLDRVVDTEESVRNQSILSQKNLGNKEKKTKKELALERYKNLLKWKEAKKKQLAMEKKRRQPAFKTGVFQPDAPKFLVSTDNDMGASVSETPGKSTFKFLVSSSRKAGKTPGSSMRKIPIFHTGVTPGTSVHRIPKFHSGVTPGVSGPKVSRSHTGVTPNEMQERDKLLKFQRNRENTGLRTRASLRRAVEYEYKETELKKSLRSRVIGRKKALYEDDLGVKPLPASPEASQAPLPLSHEEAAPGVPSFAPNNFAFQFAMSNLPSGFDILAGNNVTQRSRHSSSVLKKVRGVDGSPDETSTSVTADADPSSINQPKVLLENEEAVEKEVGKQRDNSESEDANVTETDSRYIEAKPHTGQEIDEECKSVEQVEAHEAVENVEENENVENMEENENVQNMKENEAVENVEENDKVENMKENEYVENAKECGVEAQVEESETVEQVHKFEEQEKCDVKEQVQEDENNEDECIVEERRDKYEVEEQMGPMLTTNADVAQVSVNGSDHSNNINTVKVDSGRNEDKSMPEEDTDHVCTSQEGSVGDTLDSVTIQGRVGDTLDSVSIQEENKNGYRSTRRRSVATPAKRSTRRSTACCGDDFTTPTMSRLRPRTPCSRSTRRSLSAHCDSPPEMMFTPRLRASAKKSSRRSENCVAKLNNIDESLAERDIPKCSTFYPENTVLKKKDTWSEQTLDDKAQEHVALEEKHTEKKFELPLTPTELETNSSLFVTPRSQLQDSKLSWLLKTSPWIDNSRRSSNKKKNCSTPEFQRLPDVLMSEYPVSGHPDGTRPETPADQPAVEGVVEDTSAEDQTCTNLLALLQPSAALDTHSPDIDAWAEYSPVESYVAINHPAVTPLTSKRSPPQITPASLSNHQASVSPKLTQETTTDSTLLSIEKTPTVASVSPQCKENEDPHQSLSSDAAVFVRRKSRRSVMFAVEEEENATPTFRFPGTPIRSSSRVSMGIFAKIDMNTDYIPSQNEDLISLDSPQSEKKTTATRRKSSRTSLLQGMVNSSIIEQQLPVPQDLISFDTPVKHKRRNSRSTVPNLATPSRRSLRLNKALVL